MNKLYTCLAQRIFFGLRVWKHQNVPSLAYLKMVQKITGYLVQELKASWLIKRVSVQSKEEHKPSKYTLDIVFSSDRHINELLMKVFGLRESGNCSSWTPKFNEWLLCLENNILGCKLQLFVFQLKELYFWSWTKCERNVFDLCKSLKTRRTWSKQNKWINWARLSHHSKL